MSKASVFGILGVASSELYCPSEKDFSYGGGVRWNDAGFTMRGPGGVHGKQSFNMLGGYIEFDMDTSQAHGGINNNLYLTSPARSYFPNYCDIQGGGGHSCMEMDIIENNGNCLAQTTWHTWTNHNGGCDRGGCWGQMRRSGKTHIKAEFGTNGYMNVFMDGSKVVVSHPWPSGNAVNYVRQTMASLGGQIHSTQWKGWVPGNCGWGALSSSVYSVENIRVSGTIVQGPEATKCGGPSPPSPSPPSPPTPTPSPSPPASKLWCPTERDFSYGGKTSWNDVGFTMTGPGGVHGKQSFNMLGGYIEFDIDTSHAHGGINNNLYLTFPDRNYDLQYCDIQGGGGHTCMEMDIIENNGNCLAQTTWHTWANHNGDCDQGGCWGQKRRSGKTHIKAEFSTNGFMTVYMDGSKVDVTHPVPSQTAVNYAVKTMASLGGQIHSTQWKGWVPGNCGLGDKDTSVYSVANIRVYGSIIQGPEATKCPPPARPIPNTSPAPGVVV